MLFRIFAYFFPHSVCTILAMLFIAPHSHTFDCFLCIEAFVVFSISFPWEMKNVFIFGTIAKLLKVLVWIFSQNVFYLSNIMIFSYKIWSANEVNTSINFFMNFFVCFSPNKKKSMKIKEWCKVQMDKWTVRRWICRWEHRIWCLAIKTGLHLHNNKAMAMVIRALQTLTKAGVHRHKDRRRNGQTTIRNKQVSHNRTILYFKALLCVNLARHWLHSVI